MTVEQGDQSGASPKHVAVIDVGTTSIRMAIAEIDTDGNVRTLETLSQAVSLGTDTFNQGSIQKSTIEQCVRVLKSYGEKLTEYQITEPDQLRVVATSAVREASNRLAFLDRVYIATGIQIDPLDEAEVNRITYLGIQPFLKAEPALAGANTMVVEVGGGSTELLIVKGTDVVYSHSYRLGSFRLHETVEAYRTPQMKVRDVMERQIERTVAQIQPHVADQDTVELIALGGDVRFAVSQLQPDWNGDSLASISVDALEAFTDSVLQHTEDELVHKFHLSFPEAESLGAALLAYVQLAHAFDLKKILVTNANLRDGLLQDVAARQAWTEEFKQQVIRSALDLGGRFDCDESHARHVAELSSQLFAELASEHQLDSQYEVILYVAALLHEIGHFVGQRSHHKHSLYLIRNSEVFGLGKTEMLLVALVARYHRRASPQPTHDGYSLLDRDQRIAVAKLAAILRVAVALDESRSQRIGELSCTKERGQLVISVPLVDDLSLEQLALQQSGTLFEEIFGLPVLLRKVAS